jgi:hypothetical protein
LLAIDPAQAKTIMPNHDTGWVATTHVDYKMIEDAGLAVGAVKIDSQRQPTLNPDGVWFCYLRLSVATG